MLSRFYNFCCVTTKRARITEIHKTTSKSEIGVVCFWPIQRKEKPMHPIVIHQSVSYKPLYLVLTVHKTNSHTQIKKY